MNRTLLCLAALAASTIATAQDLKVKVGDRAPDLGVVVAIGAKKEELSWSALSGKVVVLEFWFTTCGPCRQAVPHLNKLVNDYKGMDVRFVSVSFEDGPTIEKYLHQVPMEGIVAGDPTKRNPPKPSA